MENNNRRRWYNLMVAATIDRHLAPEEADYLEALRKEMGIPEDEAEQLVAQAKAAPGKLLLSGSEEDRRQALTEMIDVVLIDGRIDVRERKLLVAMAQHLNIVPEELTEMIAAGEARRGHNLTVQPQGNDFTHEKTGLKLVNIPAGRFILGEGTVGQVRREVDLPAYAIGKYAVTNEEWRRFEAATGHQGREDYGDAFNRPRQPVVGINLDDALAFCRWAGLSLPSEAQWERAARGTDVRRFPWGDDYPTASHCNFASSLFDLSKPRTMEVGSFPAGVSPAGCHDLAGNVDEWCLNPGEEKKPRAPVRGANWLSAPYALNLYYNRPTDREERANTLGFRVVLEQ